MLKKIAVSDLRLGMHLHAFDSSWVRHPFWKSRFVLTDSQDLRAAHASGIKECWINTSLGLDVGGVGQAGAARNADSVPPNLISAFPGEQSVPSLAIGPSPTAQLPSQSTSLQEELRKAQQVCRRSKQAIQSMLTEARLGRALDTAQCMPLVEEISQSVFRNPGALVSLARLKTRDEYSYMHSVAVCALMVALGRELGLNTEACREAGLAGLLHDMGKAAMPLEILNKPGKLTDEEFAVMRSHPERGYELLKGGSAPEAALDVCLHHHERIDGTGYPHRLAGDQISYMARMGAICDVYDAITSDRPYKQGWDPAESIACMISWKGHFDEKMMAAFVKSLGIYPIGSLVRLDSGKLAVVVEQNPASLVAPVVKAFYSTRSNMPINVTRIDLSQAGPRERIVKRERPTDWNFPHLAELWAGDFAAIRR